MASASVKPRFNVVQKFKSEFSPNVFSIYESARTGMRVAVVDQKGPKVLGYFALATEIHDDSGAPHTLEHLVFMGSRSYKYKGFLDKLATRAFSNTNAWTATDHTAYTLDTAGWEGFAQILPVYLEHLILPTLTEPACYTEVFHVDGTGHDAGVVYSEMQGTQNTQAELMDLRARRHIYPKSVGFRYETGGLMEALRVLTADRIREFHKEMYQPKNLCLVLIGEIDHPELLEILDKFEDTISNDVPRLDEPFDRPWSKFGRTPMLKESILDIVQFPDEDESMGEIQIGFLGPPYNDDMLYTALSVFLVYICGSSISLLENTLVETEQLASAVYYSTDTRPDIMIWFSLSGVQTSELEKVEKRFFEVLHGAADAPFDMSYLRECILRSKRQIKFLAETSNDFFHEAIIEDHLFGNRDGSDLRKLATLSEYDDLGKWDESQWRTFFKRFFIDSHHVTILGKPSRQFQENLEAQEKSRVKEQQERLGEDGLLGLAKKLEDAKTQNEQPIPRELLKQFPIPTTESIHFITTTTARSGLARDMGPLDNDVQRMIDADKTDLPTFIHVEHVPTNFVHLNLILCTHAIPIVLRPLLPIYINNFFDTPIIRGGKRLDFEEVVTQLEKDTISYSMQGDGFGNSEVLRLSFQVEPHQYETAITWIKDLLSNSIFDEVRLKANLAKALADISDEKRDGDSMAKSVFSMTHLTRDSSSRAQDTLVKAVYLRRVLAQVSSDPAAVIRQFETIRHTLNKASNFRVFVVSDFMNGAIQNPVSSWQILTSKATNTQPFLEPLDSQRKCLNEAGKNPGTLAYVVPMKTIDSSYAIFATRGPISYEDSTLPALAVAIAYLEAVEGPMWTAVRGTGLAYGTYFSRDIELGLLYFRLYRSPDALKAYLASRRTVENIASGQVELDDMGLEGAISSIVVGFANQQPTMTSAAASSFANQVMKGIPKDYSIGFMKKVRAVKPKEVRQVLQDIVVPVFMPGRSDMVVTCASIMEESLMEGFGQEGFKPESRLLASFQDDYGLEGQEGNAASETSDEEDEMDDGSDESENDGS